MGTCRTWATPMSSSLVRVREGSGARDRPVRALRISQWRSRIPGARRVWKMGSWSSVSASFEMSSTHAPCATSSRATSKALSCAGGVGVHGGDDQ